MRYDFVASELCVEKDVESSTCNGQCQMKEVAPQTEHDQQPIGMPVVEELIVPLVFHSQAKDLLAIDSDAYQLNGTQTPPVIALTCAGYTDLVAPPPKC